MTNDNDGSDTEDHYYVEGCSRNVILYTAITVGILTFFWHYLNLP